MNNRSIAFQLSIYILTAVTLVITVIVFLNYNFSKKIIIQRIEESATLQSELITNQISRNVVATQEITQNVAYQIVYYNQHGDLEFFLKQVLNFNRMIAGFHVELFDSGESKFISVVRSDAGELCVLDRCRACSMYQSEAIRERILENREGSWTDPFYCRLDSNKLINTYSFPIMAQDNQISGIISAQINLDFLADVISQIEISKNGYAFIVGSDGTYLTHPQKEFVMTQNFFLLSEKIIPQKREEYFELMRLHASASGFARPPFLNYARSWFRFSPVPYTNWSIVIAIPAKDLFQDLDLMLKKIILVSLAGLISILLIIILIFRRMLSPLSSVAKSIQRFSFGDKRGATRKNEIDLLHDSLIELQYQYNFNLQEQSKNRKDRRKFEKDLKSAKEIQSTIIPGEFMRLPEHPEVDLFANLQSAESIGGDLYDYFYIDSTHLLFTLGDVSGKGIPAALFMAVAHTMIKNKATVLSAHQIIEQVNNELSIQNTNQHFLTLFLGILNTETGELNYCNAAHNYPFLVSSGLDVKPVAKTHGLPIGVYPDKTYSSDFVKLEPGDMLVLYSDGVTDCKDVYNSFYGTERLTEDIAEMAELPVRDVVSGLLDRLETFRGKIRQTDDISIMAVRFTGKDK
ncbi:SpoIIE family protein phosphatase [Gaoshiqia sp. Z1-71]|uniref:SpoIIE family protein phosphatase n=1 Tax=Gaoshiqia hydrogeniformans TaxID=3290090 RepID=UPI003BF7A179